MLDKLPASVRKACFVSQAKLLEFPINVVREGGALVAVEFQEVIPFVVSEVPPSDHIVPFPVEPINDSTLLLFEEAVQSIPE